MSHYAIRCAEKDIDKIYWYNWYNGIYELSFNHNSISDSLTLEQAQERIRKLFDPTWNIELLQVEIELDNMEF